MINLFAFFRRATFNCGKLPFPGGGAGCLHSVLRAEAEWGTVRNHLWPLLYFTMEISFLLFFFFFFCQTLLYHLLFQRLEGSSELVLSLELDSNRIAVVAL